MSLKDEIQKLVREKKEALSVIDAERKEYRNREREKFAPLRAMLEDAVRAANSPLIRGSFGSSLATISLLDMDGNPSGDMHTWHIGPNHKGLDKRILELIEAPGFVVECTYWSDFVRSELTDRDTFENESLVLAGC
jgi:hypothetical protein